MKKIEEQFSMKFVQIFIAAFMFILIVFYFLVGIFIQDTDRVSYNSLFLLLFFVVSLMFGRAYSFLKIRQNRILHDIDEIEKYVHEIAHSKNYSAILKIEHYLELLQVAVSLKNVVKRLEKKDRKSSKK